MRAVLVVATFLLAASPTASPPAYLWVLTAWVLLVAALTTRTDSSDDAPLARLLPPERPQRERPAAADR